MARPATLARLADTATDQWGLITRRQALDAGVPVATLSRLTADSAVLQRVAHGVYRLAGAPEPDHQGLRAAWLQLAPAVPAWQRDPRDGVVSHRSAADVYGLGHLGEDQHEFTVSRRHQSRRPDVRLHQRHLQVAEWISLAGLPVTLPARIASDLLYDHEDPTAVAHVIRDALRGVFDYAGSFADSLKPHAARFGLPREDGLGLLRWMLELAGDPEIGVWISEARAHIERTSDRANPAAVRTSS